MKRRSCRWCKSCAAYSGYPRDGVRSLACPMHRKILELLVTDFPPKRARFLSAAPLSQAVPSAGRERGRVGSAGHVRLLSGSPSFDGDAA